MATYVTLKQNPDKWHHVLRVLHEQGVKERGLVQLKSFDNVVSVADINDIDRIAGEKDLPRGGVQW